MGYLEAIFLLGGLIAQVFIPGFPKETLLIQSGSSFGLVWGSLINWTGMVIGAQLAYEVVNHSVKVGGRFAGLLEKYQNLAVIQYVQERGNYGLLLLRLVPTAPNDILSMVSGALFLPRRGYILVSIFTAVPYAIFFAYLGVVGEQFLGLEQMWLINLSITAVVMGIYLINWFRIRYQSRDATN